MNNTRGDTVRFDLLVLSGMTGDLAHGKTFPALHVMTK